MSAYINKILKAIQWHDDTGGIHGALLSLSECYDVKSLVDRLNRENADLVQMRDNVLAELGRVQSGLEQATKINQKVCLECKQLDSIEAGREGYLQGLEFAATVADEMTQVPPGAWGKGAKHNAEKIARICREESGGDISWAAELKEERNRWYGKATSRQIEINKLRQALTDIVAAGDSTINFPQDGRMYDIAKNALAETI